MVFNLPKMKTGRQIHLCRPVFIIILFVRSILPSPIFSMEICQSSKTFCSAVLCLLRETIPSGA